MSSNGVLVVDDDVVVCKLMSELLSSGGYRPTAISDSRKAVELIASRSFDLVITDHNMPGMTGVELAQAITVLRPATPICLVTAELGSIPPEDLDPFHGVLEKPFDAQELRALVTSALGEVGKRPRHVSRPTRYAVDWRVDYIPLASADLAAGTSSPRRAALRDLSEHGLGLVADEALPSEGLCAFLVYSPGCTQPSLTVGEIRWTERDEGETRAGTRSLFWESERDKAAVIGLAM